MAFGVAKRSRERVLWDMFHLCGSKYALSFDQMYGMMELADPAGGFSAADKTDQVWVRSRCNAAEKDGKLIKYGEESRYVFYGLPGSKDPRELTHKLAVKEARHEKRVAKGTAKPKTVSA